MTRATTRQHPAGHRPVPVRDQDGELSCLSCGHLFACGTASRSIGSRFLPPNVANRLVQHVPEPIAEMDDDDFARAGGIA